MRAILDCIGPIYPGQSYKAILKSAHAKSPSAGEALSHVSIVRRGEEITCKMRQIILLLCVGAMSGIGGIDIS